MPESVVSFPGLPAHSFFKKLLCQWEDNVSVGAYLKELCNHWNTMTVIGAGEIVSLDWGVASQRRGVTIQSAVTSAAGSMIVRCLTNKLLRICYHNISLLSLLTLWHVVPTSMWLSDQHFSESNVKTFNFEKTCTKTRRRGIKSRISWDPWTELNEKYKECQAFHDLWGLKNLQG